mgnify:CR=1 FL=1
MLKYLINTGKTVFSSEDMAKIFHISNKNYLAVLLSRMVKRKELIRIRKGIYACSPNYNHLELANKLKRPSYISLEKVLFDNSVIFQDYSNNITSVSNNNYSERVNDTLYSYHKIKDDILMNPVGILTENRVRTASVERAVCDTVYLTKNFYFDNLDGIDKEKLLEISKIYNKRVVAEIKKYV